MNSKYFSPLFEVRNSRHPTPVEPPRFREWYTVGADLGQSQDPTAICVVRRFEETGHKPIFQVGHLERLPLGTSYPNVVAHVAALIARPEIRGKCELVIDFTGVGRPVFDMFRVQGVAPIGVNITGGTAISHEGLIWSVPKGHLISRVQALLHEGRLKIHADLPDATALVSELQSFRVEYTDSGYMRFNARVGAHDDLVLALAIALWRAYGDEQHTGIIEYYEGLARNGVAEPKQSQQQARVTLRRLGNVSTIQTVNGRSLNIPESGLVELDADEAVPFLQAGWTQVA
jgi:Terminase RNaseH-like domain